MNKTQMIPVTELYIRCSYPLRPDAIAASDTCQHPANTAVQDAEDPTRFALYERYVDEAAFEAHRRTEHFRVNIEQTLAPLLVEREWRAYGAPLTEMQS